jgi:geranylgeranyl diphosphate synthase, type II
MDTIEEHLEQVKSQIEVILDKLIPSADLEPQNLHAAMRWSVFAGGKRIRPAIVIGVGNALGASDDELLSTAAAIEMVHTYSLIHDDLPSMDNDDLRRGKATCHRQFGEATAILAGDVLQSLAFKSIAEDEKLSPEIRVKLITLIATASGSPGGMASGQQLDLDAEGRKTSIGEIEVIHRQKTGALISAAAESGAIIANAGDDEMSVIQHYSERLGLLFQITDDLLDVTQGSSELGKTAGKDLNSLKATYPAHFGIEETRNLVRTVCDEAISALEPLDANTEVLREMAAFVVSRTN